jgi:hypothetical protein
MQSISRWFGQRESIYGMARKEFKHGVSPAAWGYRGRTEQSECGRELAKRPTRRFALAIALSAAVNSDGSDLLTAFQAKRIAGVLLCLSRVHFCLFWAVWHVKLLSFWFATFLNIFSSICC